MTLTHTLAFRFLDGASLVAAPVVLSMAGTSTFGPFWAFGGMTAGGDVVGQVSDFIVRARRRLRR